MQLQNFEISPDIGRSPRISQGPSSNDESPNSGCDTDWAHTCSSLISLSRQTDRNDDVIEQHVSSRSLSFPPPWKTSFSPSPRETTIGIELSPIVQVTRWQPGVSLERRCQDTIDLARSPTVARQVAAKLWQKFRSRRHAPRRTSPSSSVSSTISLASSSSSSPRPLLRSPRQSRELPSAMNRAREKEDVEKNRGEHEEERGGTKRVREREREEKRHERKDAAVTGNWYRGLPPLWITISLPLTFIEASHHAGSWLPHRQRCHRRRYKRYATLLLPLLRLFVRCQSFSSSRLLAQRAAKSTCTHSRTLREQRDEEQR